MPTVTAARGTFGHRLTAELSARNMGARTLAKLISNVHGGPVENRRRAIIRWLRGATPTERNRHIVEEILGVPRDSLKGDDEDEEASSDEDLVDVLLQALHAFKASRENVLS